MGTLGIQVRWRSGLAGAALSASTAASAASAVPASFDDVYWPLYVRAFRLAYRIVSDRAEAEDVAAEALARAHVDWARVGSLPYRDAWVLKVAGNLARTVVRRRRRAPAFRFTPPADEDALLSRMAIEAALSSLPRRQREAIVLHYLGGFCYREIAACLGVTEASIRTHVWRGLRALRADLKVEDDEV